VEHSNDECEPLVAQQNEKEKRIIITIATILHEGGENSNTHTEGHAREPLLMMGLSSFYSEFLMTSDPEIELRRAGPGTRRHRGHQGR
jgi:hypothetical protein